MVLLVIDWFITWFIHEIWIAWYAYCPSIQCKKFLSKPSFFFIYLMTTRSVIRIHNSISRKEGSQFFCVLPVGYLRSDNQLLIVIQIQILIVYWNFTGKSWPYYLYAFHDAVVHSAKCVWSKRTWKLYSSNLLILIHFIINNQQTNNNHVHDRYESMSQNKNYFHEHIGNICMQISWKVNVH
jgi:hypothetical protein